MATLLYSNITKIQGLMENVMVAFPQVYLRLNVYVEKFSIATFHAKRKMKDIICKTVIMKIRLISRNSNSKKCLMQGGV
jgi:hypothetical protein